MSRSTTASYLINVTKNDIARGRRNDCKLCPVALAVNRRLKPAYKSSIGNPSYSINHGDVQCFDFEDGLPRQATNLITRVDRGKRVRPTSFRLTLPREAVMR